MAERKLAHLFRRRAIIFIVYVMVTNLDMSGMESRRLARSKMVGKRLKANADGEEAGTRIRKLIRTHSFFSVVVQIVPVSCSIFNFSSCFRVSRHNTSPDAQHAHIFSRARMHLHTHLHVRGSRAGEGSSLTQDLGGTSLSAPKKSSHHSLSCLFGIPDFDFSSCCSESDP